MKFQTTAAGLVSGLRFYKGALNTGTHVGSLWTASGTEVSRLPGKGSRAKGRSATTRPPSTTASKAPQCEACGLISVMALLRSFSRPREHAVAAGQRQPAAAGGGRD